jgi:hypothetical protein
MTVSMREKISKYTQLKTFCDNIFKPKGVKSKPPLVKLLPEGVISVGGSNLI